MFDVRSKSMGRSEDVAPQHGEGTTSTTIVVVDDDAGIRGFMGEALTLAGYRVVAVADRHEAERVLQRLGAASVHLVISDVHLTIELQAQDGYALYQRCAMLYPSVPFLLISGHPSSRALPAVHDGSVQLLPKPFSLNELLAVVRSLIAT